MARRRTGRWRMMFATIVGIVTVAIGLIFLARWD